jgi:hypothetical protein
MHRGLIPIKLEALSSITYSAGIPRKPPDQPPSAGLPDFAYVKFEGWHSGTKDVDYMLAMIAAHQRVTNAVGVIVDLTDFDYSCGEEMEWIFDVGWEWAYECQRPLAIIVGPQCKSGLQTLDAEVFEENCVESYADAVELIAKKRVLYDENVKRATDRVS